MARPRPDTLKPRKLPRQARAAVTVDAMLEAAIQVLLAEGVSRLTTTRVAERAGVSVGTLYQYFPNKQSLLYAVLEKHLDAVATAVETACRDGRGRPAAAMAEGLVNAYLDVKTENIAVSRALYLVASELDTADLMGGISQRFDSAIRQLLATAPDVNLSALPSISFALRAVLAGSVRTILERGATPAMLRILRSELPVICGAYLKTAAIEE